MSIYQEGPPQKQNSNPKILHKQSDPEGPWGTRDPVIGLEILLCSQKHKPRTGMQNQRAEGEARTWGPGCSLGHAPSHRPRPVSLNGARAQIALLLRIQTAPPRTQVLLGQLGVPSPCSGASPPHALQVLEGEGLQDIILGVLILGAQPPCPQMGHSSTWSPRPCLPPSPKILPHLYPLHPSDVSAW